MDRDAGTHVPPDVRTRNAVDHIQKRIIELEALLPTPNFSREISRRTTCVIPGCAHWFVGGLTTVDTDEYWRGHMKSKHPDYYDAYIGFIEDTINIGKADGTLAVYQQAGISMKTSQWWIGLSKDGTYEWRGAARVRIPMTGQMNLFNEEEVRLKVKAGSHGTVTHFALFATRDARHPAFPWKPLDQSLGVIPGDTIRFRRGVLQVTQAHVNRHQYSMGGVQMDGVMGPATQAARPDVSAVMHTVPAPRVSATQQRVAARKKKEQERAPKPIPDMGYRVKLGKRWGYWVRIDMADGGTWEIWRPTSKSADTAGYNRLRREVMRAERLERLKEVRTMTWGQIRGTANADTSKDHAEWDEKFNGQ